MRYTGILLVALFLCAMGAGTGTMLHMASQVPCLEASRETVGSDLYGNELRLSDYRGKVVLLVFWMSGGEHAQQQQAVIQRLQQKFKGQPFAVVGVNADASRAFAQAAAERGGYDYHSWYDGPRGPIARSWLVTEYPTFYLLDADGDTVQRYDDFLWEMEVEMDIAGLLREARQQ